MTSRPGFRARALLPALVIAGWPWGAVTAQTRPEPQLLLTILGGVSTGTTLYGNLRQRLNLIEDPAAIDTVALGRRLSTGILIGASTTFFPSAHVGLTAEMLFHGPGLDDDCTVVHRAPSPIQDGYNEAVCSDIAATGRVASTIAFSVGGLYRIAPRGGVKPYVRAQAGITLRNGSTVEVTGRFLDAQSVVRSRVVIADPDARALHPTASIGAGVMVPFAPGYQVRLEGRDQLLFVRRVTGPADALAIAPTERILVHSIGLVLMLDIVLEQKRGRRY
jgi:hypothetical protein